MRFQDTAGRRPGASKGGGTCRDGIGADRVDLLADGWKTRSNRRLWVMATRAGRGRRWVVLDEDMAINRPHRRKRKPGARLTCFRLVAHAIAWSVFLAFLVFATGWVEPIFADFGFPLPNVTILADRGIAQDRRWRVASPCSCSSSMGWSSTCCRRGDVLRAWSWSSLMIATPLSLVAVMLWALLLPLLTCRMRLSG